MGHRPTPPHALERFPATLNVCCASALRIHHHRSGPDTAGCTIRFDDGPCLSGVSSTVLTHDTSRNLLRAAGTAGTAARSRLLRWAIGVALPLPPIYPWVVSRSLLRGRVASIQAQRLPIPRTRGMSRGSAWPVEQHDIFLGLYWLALVRIDCR